MKAALLASPATYLVLLISCANLAMVTIAFFNAGESAGSVPSAVKPPSSGRLAFVFLFVSQFLFVALDVIGLRQWHQFRIGDLLTLVPALCGVSLSIASLALAPLGTGRMRFVRLFVAIWTLLWWVLSVLATVTV
jgi:hypothetical protein